MPMLVADIPQYVESPAYIAAHVHVAAAHNWNLSRITPETLLVPKVPKEAAEVSPVVLGEPLAVVDYTVCASAQAQLHFATKQFNLAPDSLSKALQALPKQCAWDVAGYTDPRGSTRFNAQLGLKRAQGVQDWMLSNGYEVWPAKSFGKQHLLSGGAAKQFWKDRRVEITSDTQNP